MLAASLPRLPLCINSLLEWIFQLPFSNHGAPSLGLVTQPRVDFQTLCLRPLETLTLPHIFGKGTWRKAGRIKTPLRGPGGRLLSPGWSLSERLCALLISGASFSPLATAQLCGVQGIQSGGGMGA